MDNFTKIFIDYINRIISVIEPHSVIDIFILVFLTLLSNLLATKFLKKLQNKAKRGNNYDKIIIQALRLPSRIIIFIVGTSFILETIYVGNNSKISLIISNMRTVGLILSFALFALKFAKEFEVIKLDEMTKDGRYTDRTTVRAISKLLRITILITTIIISFQTVGIKVTGFVTIAGLGTAAIGFASKDLIANFFGTAIVYMDKPFSEGDWISSPEKQIEGTVEEIGWRMTKIRTFDRRPIYVPNSIFSTVVIQNNSRMYNRRFRKIIGIRYNDVKVVENISRQISELLNTHTEIDQKQTIYVKLVNFSSYSVDIDIYSFTKTTNWMKFQEIQHELLLKIANIIKENNAQFAFPTTTVDYLPKETNPTSF